MSSFLSMVLMVRTLSPLSKPCIRNALSMIFRLDNPSDCSQRSRTMPKPATAHLGETCWLSAAVSGTSGAFWYVVHLPASPSIKHSYMRSTPGPPTIHPSCSTTSSSSQSFRQAFATSEGYKILSVLPSATPLPLHSSFFQSV